MINDDIALIQRILADDEAAFEELVNKYRKAVHTLAWRKIGDFHIAEDITQDTFLKVYQRLHTLKDPGQFSGWLYVITSNLCSTWLRKKRVQTQPLEDADTTMTPRDVYSQHVVEERKNTAVESQREVVKKLLAKLKESERTVMALHYLGEMKVEEISRFLGVSASTIKSRLRRARNRLQKEETMIREALDHFQLSPNLTDNIMQEVSRLKPTPSASKPLVPWAIAAASAVILVLLLGIGSQQLLRFQQPYNLDAQAEMTIELVDAPIVLNLNIEPDDRNQIGENANGIDRNSLIPHDVDTKQSDFAQEDAADKSSVTKSQWTPINSPSAAGTVWSLSATPEGEVYTVLDYGGICKLTPNGDRWQLLTPMKGGGYASTVHIAKWNDTLYFTPGDELLVSTNEGKTWESLNSPVRQGANYYDFVFTDKTFFLREGTRLYRSDNAGKSWKKISIHDQWYGIRFLVSIENTVFAATNTTGTDHVPGIYRLNNSINTWEHISLTDAVRGAGIQSVSTTENTLYVMVEKRGEFDARTPRGKERSWWIFRSTDLGDSWIDITPKNAWSLVGFPPDRTIVAVRDTVLVIGKHDVSIARSTDKGNTWSYAKNTGISRKFSTYSSVMHAVAINEKTFYLGGTSGIHRSTDGGKSWHRFNAGLGSRIGRLYAFEDDGGIRKVSSPVLYAITESNYNAGDLVKSIDGGSTWEAVDVTPISASDSEDAHQEFYPPRIVKVVASNGILYAKGENYNRDFQTKIYRISDDGSTLIPIDEIPTFDSKPLHDELQSFAQQVRDSDAKFPPSQSFISNLQSNYVGSSEFMKEASMTPTSSIVQHGLQGTFAVSDNTFYMEYNYKLFRWGPGDSEWHDTGLEETAQLDVPSKRIMTFRLAVSGKDVYVGTRNGKLLHSSNSGDTWKDITPTSLANFKSPYYMPTIKDIVLVGTAVYVATHKGVMTYDGKNWHTLTDKTGEKIVMSQLAVSGTTIYGVSMTNEFYRLESSSGKWKQVASEISGSITSFVADRDVLFVGTSRQGVFRFQVSN